MNMQCKTNSKYDTSNDNYDISNTCMVHDHIEWSHNTYGDHIDLFINMIIFSMSKIFLLVHMWCMII